MPRPRIYLYGAFRTRHIGEWGAALLTFPPAAQWTDDDLDHYLVMLHILLMPQGHATKEGAARVVAGPAYVSGPGSNLKGRAQAATSDVHHLLYVAVRSRRSVEIEWEVLQDPELAAGDTQHHWIPALTEQDYLEVRCGCERAAFSSRAHRTPSRLRDRPQILARLPHTAACHCIRARMLEAADDPPRLLAAFGLANRLLGVVAMALRSFPGSDYRQFLKRCAVLPCFGTAHAMPPC